MFNLEVLNIVYHHGKENVNTDTLSYLQAPDHGIAEYSIQVATVTSVNKRD